MPLTLRTVSNTGDPLCKPDGTLLAAVPVTFTLVTPRGLPIDAWDAITHERIVGVATVTTDSAGEFTTQLWPTDRSNVPALYLCHVPGVRDFLAALPSGATAFSWAELMANGLPLTAQQLDVLDTYRAWFDSAVVATAADRVQTGLDKTATAADRVQTGLDRTQTGSDKTATAADRVQTGLDRTSATASAATATTQAGLATTNGAAQVALAATQAGLAASNGATQVALATAQASDALLSKIASAASAAAAAANSASAASNAAAAGGSATSANTALLALGNVLANGIGALQTDANGDLTVSYNSPTVTSMAIDAAGNLTVTYP